ncbi:hypothetical protein SLS62_009577 [Diatrype stigma]|uniref:Uncharacterized protein n=1 Tax=Diatrype stigma TaxID=117547 RepID=A0AAN9UG06_9PEZI
MDNPDPFNGDEDAALRYAIELSLQDVEQPIIELSSDSDDSDDDLDKQPTYPPVAKASVSSSTQGSKGPSLPALQPAPSPTPTTSGLGGLDRKRMEEERLARLGKRKAPDSTQETQERKQRARVDEKPAASSRTAHLPFPTGVVKKTWAKGYARTGDDIKIEEVLQRDELELAVLSSFQWDEDWLLSKIDIAKTKMLLIAFASSVEQVLLPFEVPGIQDLLKYSSGYLRVVIPSGNLVPYDWGETGVMENSVFIIDLPRKEDEDPGVTNHHPNESTLFKEELCYFLQAQGLDDSLIKSLSHYDFSATERYRFVHSM